MISCKKGICEIDGPDYEIEADLTVLIHAIDVVYSKKMGKEKAQERINKCYDTAMKNRDFDTDEEIGEKVADEVIKALKKLEKILSDLVNESEEE